MDGHKKTHLEARKIKRIMKKKSGRKKEEEKERVL